MKRNTQPEQIGPMTSYSLMCGVILLYLRNSTIHDPATCLSNKLTYLIYDGVEKLIEEQAKTLIEGSSAANMTRHDWKGTGRRIIGQKKKKKKKKKKKIGYVIQ